jgi:hypothetical protein
VTGEDFITTKVTITTNAVVNQNEFYNKNMNQINVEKLKQKLRNSLFWESLNFKAVF